MFKLGRPSPDLWLHRGSPEAVSSPDPSARSANHSPERQTTVRLNGKPNHFVLPRKQLNYYETETESEEDEEQCSESESESDEDQSEELSETQQRARRLDQLGSALAASCDFWYIPDDEEAEEEDDEEEQENHYVYPSTSSDIASSCVFWSMNDPSESDGSNEEVTTKTSETEIRRKSASPLVNFTLDLGASCEANVCISREDDSEFEDESIWDEEWDEEVTEEDEEGCPSIPTTNSAALNSVFWDMLDTDIREELDIRKEILSATRVADGKPALENGTSSSSQELNETFTVRLRDSSTPVPEDSDENTAEFVMSNYSRREGSPMPDTEAASTSFTMRMGLIWLGSNKPPGSKSKPMGLPLPRS